jgi:hypothetical protein
MTEACSGRSGKLNDVAWYVVPGETSVSEGFGDFAGIWSPGGNTIVLAGDAQFVGSLVRHEMLHALLYGGGHPRALFLGTCAGIVACIDDCIKDAGPPPTPADDTPRVPPDSIVVDVVFDPTSPNAATVDGWFTLTVTARNPADHPVVVLLPPSGDAGPSGSFGWEMNSGSNGAKYDDRADDPGVAYFAPGETKRDVFDLQINGAPGTTGMLPGDYVATGSYGDHASAPASVTLTP